MTMSAEMREKMLDTVREAVRLEVVPINERLTKIEEAPPVAIHSEKGIIDDGMLRQVGDNLFQLPQGAVVNTSHLNIDTKGLRRNGGGIFEQVSEPMMEFAARIKEYTQSSVPVKFISKDPDFRRIQVVTKDTQTVADAMSSADDSSAGLFVPEDIRYALLQFAPPGTIVWPRAQVWPMTSDKITWPKLSQDLTDGSESFFGNVELVWTEEGGSKAEQKAEFDRMSLECKECSAYAPITDQLLQDSAINIGNLLVQLFQGAYWHGTDREFLRGMGGSRPMGILNAPGVTSISRVTANRVRFKDIINMHSQLPPMFESNAVWMMKKQVFNQLRSETDANGRPLIELGWGYNNFGEGIAGYILGLPVVMSDYKTSSLGSTGDVILGDWKHYFIGERKTISVEMSRHVLFRQNMTAFRASARVGGTPEQEKAFVVLNATADSNMS